LIVVLEKFTIRFDCRSQLLGSPEEFRSGLLRPRVYIHPMHNAEVIPGA